MILHHSNERGSEAPGSALFPLPSLSRGCRHRRFLQPALPPDGLLWFGFKPVSGKQPIRRRKQRDMGQWSLLRERVLGSVPECGRRRCLHRWATNSGDDRRQRRHTEFNTFGERNHHCTLHQCLCHDRRSIRLRDQHRIPTVILPFLIFFEFHFLF